MSKASISQAQVKALLMQDEAFRLEYEKLKPRYELISEIIRIRKENAMTQQDLATKVGTSKSNISRLEGGTYNPSLDFLYKIAKGLGKEVHVELR